MKDTLPEPGIRLTLKQARANYKDLISYDAMRTIDSIRISQIADLRFAMDQKIKELEKVEERERNWKLAYDSQVLLTKDEKARTAILEKDLIRSRRWGRVKVVLIGAVGAYAIYQSLK